VVAAHHKKDDLLNCWTSSSDISGYRVDFHEGHGTVGAWQGYGMAWRGTAWAQHGMCELMARHGTGMAWARHATCDSALWRTQKSPGSAKN